MSTAVVLYGPPAVGKDTVTSYLVKLGPFSHFERLKCGPGRTTGYRMIEEAELVDVVTKPGEVIWRDDRYGATYLVDRSHVEALVAAGLVPVLHLGRPDAVNAVARALPSLRWVVVDLYAPRDVVLKRVIERGTGDTSARLRAYDSTPRLDTALLSIDTSAVDASTAATEIADAVLHQTQGSL